VLKLEIAVWMPWVCTSWS